MTKYINENNLKEKLYIFDGFVGADTSSRLSIRVITDKAWHSLFANSNFHKTHHKKNL